MFKKYQLDLQDYKISVGHILFITNINKFEMASIVTKIQFNDLFRM